MGFYDNHTRTENIGETIKTSKQLGFSGICLATNWTNPSDLQNFKKQVQEFKITDAKEIDIAVGVEIKDKPNKIPELVNKIRKEADVILVHGGDLEVNRVSAETPEIDILLHSELGREDSGIDHTMARLAKKNNVSIEFSLSDLIQSSKVSRAKLLHSLMENAKLVRKYKAPFVLTSGAFDAPGLRSPSELLSFGRVLGFQDPEIKKSLSDHLVKENRKRLSGKWVMPGVEVVD